MIRHAMLVFGCLFLLGCANGPEPRPNLLQPLNGRTDRVGDILDRARYQATSATEAFYLDDWNRLDSLSLSLQDTAKLLAALPLPIERQKDYAAAGQRLTELSTQLRVAAREKNVADTSNLLAKVGLEVRTWQAAFGAIITESPSMP